jgi:hypothetical protein
VVLALSSLSCVNIYNFPSIPEPFRCLVLQQILFIGAVVFGLIFQDCSALARDKNTN